MSAKFVSWKNGKGHNYAMGSDKEIDKLAHAYLEAGKAKRAAGAALAKAISGDVGVPLAVSESKWPNKTGAYDISVFPATRTASSGTVQSVSGADAFKTKAA